MGMRIISIILLLVSFSFFSFCQTPRWKKPRYLVKIEDKEENFILTGALYDITDSSVILTCSTCKYAETENFQIVIPFQKMDEISLHRNSRFTNWILAGGASGATGLIFAYLSHKDNGYELFSPYPLFQATVAVCSALPFFVVGIIRYVSVEDRIVVNKDFGKFSVKKDLIKKYCFIQ